MRRALAHPAYRRLFLAQVVALAGTGLATVALGLLAYQLEPADAAGVLGTAFAIKMVAYVGVAPLAAAALARLPRRAVLVGADAVRLVVALALPFVDEAWHIYVLIFLLQAASATFTPTFQSVIPDVLEDEDDYTAALSLSRLAYDLEAVLSPALAAVLLLVVPASALFFGTAIGFAGSALLVLATAVPARRIEPDAPEAPFGDRARHGVRLFVRTRALRPILALNLAVAAAGAFVLVQTVVIARGSLGLGDEVVAMLLAANGAGSMLAALALPAVLRRAPERRVMLGAAALLAVATALAAGAVALPGLEGALLVGALWFAVGVGWSAVETPVGRLIRRGVPAGDLGAAFAAQFSLSHACWLLTYPLAGWLGVIGLPGTALVLAGVAAIATVVAWRLWHSAPARRAPSESMLG
ncbi:MFS transporter [Agrococcus sp. TF02-05]|uniref:MFS transporter n=1 Tax=Agrococcus sp. TF02-05 TaxID=2815211 RepID=UPI001AA1366C|nr:MFS transporter [Agrococcus sp. TF02-05]MBO1770107.1 MFS transporter [Agrococcus sp. TF02-05]